MDVVTLDCPPHPDTEHMVNTESIGLRKRRAFFVNPARGRDVAAAALQYGTLDGYAGHVWFSSLHLLTALGGADGKVVELEDVYHGWRWLGSHGSGGGCLEAYRRV